MSNSITGGIQDALGIDTTAGNADIQKALEAIQAVRPPTASQLTLPELKQYVQAGILTPQQYQAITADPETYSKVIAATTDNSGMNAQKAALQQLGGVVQAGGSTPINEANLQHNIDSANQADKANRGAIMQNAQERNVSGGGLDFISQLLGEQNNAVTSHAGAVDSAANNAKLALDALTQSGNIGGQLQGQANQSAQAQAEAARQIAEYNSQLRSSANQYNTQAANDAAAANLGVKQDVSNANVAGVNDRARYNATVPQTVFGDQMAQAGATADAYGKKATIDQAHAQQDAAFTGSLIGAGATMGGSYAAGNAAKAPVGKSPNTDQYYNGYAMGGEVHGKCYAEGGEVHDHGLCMKAGGEVPGEAETPGDDTQNDTVPAMLSPDEIVLPRSVATAPDAPQKAAQFVDGVKGQGMTPTVGSFAEALKMLEDNGLELRLQVRQ